MNLLACALEMLLKFFAHLMGHDILIMPDAPDKSLFDFKRWQHGRQGCEYFGLGLHVIVSPQDAPRKTRSTLNPHELHCSASAMHLDEDIGHHKARIAIT